ncbi:hypothetical protein WDU94_009848 [Cyamophila willieti]
MKQPANSGTDYYNYKGHFSIILQAIADEKCRFTSVDVGAFGRQSDGGVFQNTQIYQDIEVNGLMPPDKPLPHSMMPVPHVLLGDQGYPLKAYLMKPYSRQNATEDQTEFNRKLSGVRRTVECAFGILVSKWRLLKTEIQCTPENTEKIVKAMCLLHNIIIDREGQDETNFYLNRNENGGNNNEDLVPLNPERAHNRYGQNAWLVRERFKNYMTR